MLKKLWCRWLGHKRGKRLFTVNANDANGQRTADLVSRFVCPRCGTEWTRKVKAKAVTIS